MEVNFRRRRNSNGIHLHWHYRRVLRIDMGIDEDVREPGRTEVGRTPMSWLYIISGLIAAGLLVYLFVALLKPEKFE